MPLNVIRLTLVVLLWSSLASGQERNTDAGANAQQERPRSVALPPRARTPQAPPAQTSQTPAASAPTPRSFTPSETVSADAEVRFPVDI